MQPTFTTRFLFSRTIMGLDLSGAEYKVFMFLANTINRLGRIFYKQSTIAKKLGLSLSIVSAALRKLESANCITSKKYCYSQKKKKRVSSNEYFISIPLSKSLASCDARLVSLLTSTQLKLLQEITYRIGQNETCYITIENLAKACAISYNNAYRTRKQLERLGILISFNGLKPTASYDRNVYMLGDIDGFIASQLGTYVEYTGAAEDTDYEFEEFVSDFKISNAPNTKYIQLKSILAGFITKLKVSAQNRARKRVCRRQKKSYMSQCTKSP